MLKSASDAKNQYGTLQSNLDDMENETTTRINNYITEIDELKNMNSKLTKTNRTLDSDLNDANSEIMALQNKYEDLDDQLS